MHLFIWWHQVLVACGTWIFQLLHTGFQLQHAGFQWQHVGSSSWTKISQFNWRRQKILQPVLTNCLLCACSVPVLALSWGRAQWGFFLLEFTVFGQIQVAWELKDKQEFVSQEHWEGRKRTHCNECHLRGLVGVWGSMQFGWPGGNIFKNSLFTS